MVEVAFTDGVDLSERPGSDRDRLEQGLRTVATATGARVARMSQVHGADVATLGASYDPAAPPPHADALVTDERGLALLARAADCVPVLLADADAGVVGAVHAGRAGVAAGVVGRAVEAMAGLGAQRLRAWVGPHVCGACYEVPAALHDEVVAHVPATSTRTPQGTPALDLGAGVLAQLADAGCDDVVQVGVCTREDPAWPSHRRDGEAAGRFAGVVWLP
ncbi:polyphenol oxidase family protein [Nocardioides perillae]|uniref:polyphenol oxidase family protein n=1 Tax=Nocardioides perillae TaxID=1119534 RepID=UPI0015CC1375